MESPPVVSRLMWLAAAAALLTVVARAQPRDQRTASQTDLSAAGVCSRCHIHNVVAWGVSGHPAARVNCVSCHGDSQGHVLDERNNVKPDRVPRGAAISALCQNCHGSGCPRVGRKDACETCHHVHALLDVRKQPQAPGTAEDERSRNESSYREAMAEGETLVKQGSWNQALDRFERARKLRPGDRQVAGRLEFCRRRLNPEIGGFRILGGEFDPESGLPLRAEVAELNLKMVLVPGGDLDIGEPAFPDSRLVHTVHVEPFYLGQYEVTQGQWLKTMESNPSVHGAGFSDSAQRPVESVSWQDCQDFVERLNRRVRGASFRLPTEAEWEYAARRGSARDVALSVQTVAWFRENSGTGGEGPLAFAPRPVGLKTANALGLYDMQGNVWEWCSSLFRPYPYDAQDGREDPGRAGLRVLRGGGYLDTADLLAAGFRYAERPDRRFRWNGLRVARSIPKP